MWKLPIKILSSALIPRAAAPPKIENSRWQEEFETKMQIMLPTRHYKEITRPGSVQTLVERADVDFAGM